MFSASERVLYGKRQLIEVICQLRFPTILSISAKEPAEFQEAIRAEFPRYARNLEKLPPKVIGQPGAMKLEEQPTVVNYQFLTAAGDWKVNLTNTFLALATPVYTTWEDFARKLDEVLAQFVAIYHPAYFERIGLRYINGFSRRALGLEGRAVPRPYSARLSWPDGGGRRAGAERPARHAGCGDGAGRAAAA